MTVAGTPSLAVLIERHRASARLSVTTSVDALHSPVSTPANPIRLEVSWGPGDRWRVDRAGVTVYVRDGHDAFMWHDGEMHKVAADTRQMVALQPVNPLWFFGDESLLMRWADTPVRPGPDTATVVGAVTVDGRPGWRIACPDMNAGNQDDPLEFVVDDATGLLLRIASSSGHLVGTLRDLRLVERFSSETFTWTGPVASPPDENDDPITIDRVSVGRCVGYLGDDAVLNQEPGARFAVLHSGHPGRIVDVASDSVVVQWSLFEQTPMRLPVHLDGKNRASGPGTVEHLTEISHSEYRRREAEIAERGTT